MPVRVDFEKRFLMITFLGVLFIGIFSARDFLKEPVEPLSTRKPASVSQLATKLDLSKNYALNETLEINCSKLIEESNTEATHVRFKGLCKEPGLSLTNLSNGFTASVILSKNSEFSTDFINLSEGLNRIQITKTEGDGSISKKELLIHRRLPASLNQ